jgi:hypothetical protein
MSRYTDRGAHYFHPRKLAARSIGVIRPRSAGRSSNSASSISGSIRRIARRETGVLPGARCCKAVRAHVRDAAGSSRPGTRACRHNRYRGGQRLHPRGLFCIREVYLPAHNARFAVVPAGEGLAFTPVPAVCARISSRRGSRSVSIPVHVYPDGTPSFTGRAASAATTRTERSEMRKAPLKSARRRNPVDGMDKPLARLPRPQANKAEETDIRCATKTGQLNSLSTGDTLKVVVGPGAFA